MNVKFKIPNEDYIHWINSFIREEVGHELQRYRESQNLSIKEVSDCFKIRPGGLADIERNLRRTTWPRIKNIAGNYGLEIMVELTVSARVKLLRS